MASVHFFHRFLLHHHHLHVAFSAKRITPGNASLNIPFKVLPRSNRDEVTHPSTLLIKQSAFLVYPLCCVALRVVFQRAASGGELGAPGVAAMVALAVGTVFWLVADGPEEAPQILTKVQQHLLRNNILYRTTLIRVQHLPRYSIYEYTKFVVVDLWPVVRDDALARER